MPIKRVPVDDLEAEIVAIEQANRVLNVTVDADEESASITYEPRATRTAPGDVETRA